MKKIPFFSMFFGIFFTLFFSFSMFFQANSGGTFLFVSLSSNYPTKKHFSHQTEVLF